MSVDILCLFVEVLCVCEGFVFVKVLCVCGGFVVV